MSGGAIHFIEVHAVCTGKGEGVVSWAVCTF